MQPSEQKNLVSVVVPCYNQGIYLRETVLSVLESTYRPLEVIIVNDGSKDDSLQLARALAEEFPEVRVIDQDNGGVSKARNTGIEASNGSIILPLDGDDLISSDYIAAAVEVLKSQPSVKVVYSKGVKFDDSGEKSWNLKPFSRHQLALDNMIFCSALFRKVDWLKAGKYSVEMRYMGREDWEFWIKMLKDGGEVVQLPFIGFYYRLTPNSKRKKTSSAAIKRERIAFMNSKHAAFFARELNGPLRFRRSWSKPYNTMLKWLGLF
ncbi:glycosyltransferase family 2 protein [Echinicola vietnamensis]|uniref:Glycosyl transferase n=1 Tax=Echinicola vietnamensis (strain DSM 17526 / LMG 23754 / KMM 6221) TaxID=926556 RepID=L0FSQ7_ECHVK|nr:glycosyltransferase family A protein [Echinicola vietnamensis]AGA76954.1 glycosyl transferase [Echinicola vietnamensis DSM 17526]